MVADDGAWAIRAFSKVCAGKLNVDDSAPARLANPRGSSLADRSISFKSAKE